MLNQNVFYLDTGFWGFFYKILTPIEWLQTWILKLVHDFFVMLGMSPIGVSWVIAIICLVLVVQAGIFPLFYKQMKSMRKMQALAPKMQRIQNKYKGKTDQASKEAMSREMMKLYQDNDANPAGSCLPMLIQGPVFMSMFYTLSAIPFIAREKRGPLGAFDVDTAQQFTKTDVFGVVSVGDNFGSASTSGKVVIGIFVFLMCFCLWFVQYFSMKRNMAAASMNKQTETMQKMMLWVFPLMYIFSGTTMPFAVLVYWLTSNVCNLLRTLWQVTYFPTPGSPAAADKEKRDHRRENERRAKAGQPSLEEEALQKAKEEAARKETQGYQRQQPVRKRKKK
ncbi:60Kd inner membrane protein [Bifidobacterium myosotis]|uniref:Membrane protein insertase YidC n=1 Tax=Bifidobacterium myosotis TaxID=1630166 RepID=A0A261FMV1_9BIFI|nr:membrane protein insertase YidC [Bifidobacterium myosotis]OZG60146.1 60Kd inner membrane protein [Bifidobacterium myosotis]